MTKGGRADGPSGQTANKRLGELQVVQFIIHAVRSGQRAILVTGRSQVSVRAPEAALAACSSASTRTLHIGPPLPEPPELQEMIGAAVGIAGGRALAPRAMAERLLLSKPRQIAILAIDDAHTLSHRSLSYLSQMTELLVRDAPVLQIVLAAGPALLDTLARPEFESLRKRLCRPAFETFGTSRWEKSDGALSDPRKRALGGAVARPTHIRDVQPAAASPRKYGAARPAAYAAAGLAAMGCLAAIGYSVFPAFSAGPTQPNIPSINSAAAQEILAPSDPSQSSAQLEPSQTHEVVDALIDELMDAVASGSDRSASPLLQRIANLETSATPEAVKLLTAMTDRFAARISAAAAAGRVDEARRLEQFYSRHSRFLRLAYSAPNERSIQSQPRAAPGAASSVVDPPGQDESEQPGVRQAVQAMAIARPCRQTRSRRQLRSPPRVKAFKSRNRRNRRRLPRLPRRFRQSNPASQTMAIEPCRQPLRSPPRIEAFKSCNRRNRRRLPRLPLHFRQSNPAPQAMAIERPRRPTPLRQPLRSSPPIKAVMQRSPRYWPKRRRPRLMAQPPQSARACRRLRLSASY
jgi:hypothetical protein